MVNVSNGTHTVSICEDYIGMCRYKDEEEESVS